MGGGAYLRLREYLTRVRVRQGKNGPFRQVGVGVGVGGEEAAEELLLLVDTTI